MTTLVLDRGAVTKLAWRTKSSAAVIRVLARDGLWPPTVPAAVVVESITGRPSRDANTNWLLSTCSIETDLSEASARRAARLRFLAKAGSAVDAIVVEAAEPGGAVLTGDIDDLSALASHAVGVRIHRI